MLVINSKPRKRLTKSTARKRLITKSISQLLAALASGLFLFSSAHAKTPREASLTITADNGTKTFTRTQLLQSPEVKTVRVERDPAYQDQPMSYQAVPLAILFKDVKLATGNTLLFKCLDGFSAPISAARILNRESKAAVAFLAVEPAAGWPRMKNGKTPGPFYVVWENPKASNIGTEEWPFQLSGFEVKPSFEAQFPKTVPDSKLSVDSPVLLGYQTFQKTCFACHRLNDEGASRLGPDLNVPLSPTEYLQASMIEKLVRNPQSLRRWPEAKMPALGPEAISDRDLQNVVEYLKHMAKRKTKLEN